MPLRDVTTWSLELTSPDRLRPGREPREPIEVRRVEAVCPELNRFLYTAVGGNWFWIDRLNWTYATWQEYLTDESLETWVGWAGGCPCGYFELQKQGTSAEIVYFGLLPQFVGKGFGGVLLTHALRRGFELADRVWVHTCSLDGPHALANYQARGMSVFAEITKSVELPDAPPGPWPGA